MTTWKIHLKKELLAGDETMELDVDFEVQSGEVLAVYGPSGAGKTSILRMLAGLMEPDGGEIEVDEKPWYSAAKKISLPPQQRSVGLVFQDYALFPHLTVRGNLEYALSPTKDPEWIDRLLEKLTIGDLPSRMPNTLSGGQKQRVALARALVRRPQLFLLDEPLSALDRTTRHQLQKVIAGIHRELEPATILVSHNLAEVFHLAHKVVVLNRGKIVERGTPEEVFIRGKVSGKFRFVGEVVHLEPAGVVYLVTVLVGQHAVQVVVGRKEGERLEVGDQVVLASKAFNPILLPKG